MGLDYPSSLVVSPDDFRVDANGRYRRYALDEGEVWTRAHAVWRRLVELPFASCAYLVCGAPGAGKSTLAARISEVHAIDDRRPVVFDATLSRRLTRARIASVAAERGLEVHAIVMSTPLDECLLRNASRRASRYVPPLTVREIYSELVESPPVLSEGLTSVTYVDDFAREVG